MHYPDPVEVTVPARIALSPEMVAQFFCELPATSQAAVLDVIATTMAAWPNGEGTPQREAIATQLTPQARDWITALATLAGEESRS